VEATVKWYNPEKGFGFVELADGSGDAFVHVRAVEAAGHTALDPGTRLSVRVGQGQKGAQVTEISSVDTSTAQPSAPRDPFRGPRPGAGPRAGGAPRRNEPSGPTEERTGQVKWYNPEKGFGFVAMEDGGKDVFLHRSVLSQAGLSDIDDGQRVRMNVVQGQKGPEASSVEILG
jgi:CspA family cold shock protein